MRQVTRCITFKFDLFNGFLVIDNKYIEIIIEILEIIDKNSHNLPSKIKVIARKVPKYTIEDIWCIF